MKNFFATIVLLCIFFITYGQSVVQQVAQSIGKGNVGEIVQRFDNAVSLTILGEQSTYSRSQAEMVLRDFFGKNNVKNFSMEHEGGANGSSYVIGALHTSTGKYRTYFAVKQKDGDYVIQEIRIEQ